LNGKSKSQQPAANSRQPFSIQTANCKIGKLLPMFLRLAKRYVFFLLFLVSINADINADAQKDVIIRIVQDDSVYSPEKVPLQLRLKRKTFKIQVLLQNISGVYAFASFRDSLFRLPDDRPVPGLDSLTMFLIREEDHNKEKELLVSNEGWCHWCLCPETGSKGFNKKMVLLDSGRVVGIKTVKQLFLPPLRQAVKLKDNSKPLYLFFVAIDDPSNGPVRELLRRKVKIEWEDED
jgi:hypothetical protein